MAEKKSDEAVAPAVIDDSEMRNVLAKRLAIAGALVAILLGLLGLFDHLSQPGDEEELPVFTRPVPVVPKKMLTQPVTPAELVAEEPGSAAGGLAEAKPKPVSTTQPPANEVPPAPVVAATPGAGSDAASVKATVAEMPPQKASTAKIPARVSSVERSGLIDKTAAPEIVERTESPQALPASPRTRSSATPAPAAVPSAAAPAVTAIVAPAPAKSAPTARVVESVPAAAASRLFSGFILQAGVFTSAARAEELHARLTLSGIPSSIEARVQVGPFNSRQEALAAQEKMRELGVESLLVPPKGGR